MHEHGRPYTAIAYRETEKAIIDYHSMILGEHKQEPSGNSETVHEGPLELIYEEPTDEEDFSDEEEDQFIL